MKNLHDLSKINVPNCEDYDLKTNLHKNLANKFVKPKNVELRYRISLVTSFLFMTLFAFALLQPMWLQKLKLYLSGKDEVYSAPTEVKGNMFLTDYTSIHNPRVQAVLNSKKYKEKSAYVIRTYEIEGEEDLVIFSEYKAPKEDKKEQVKEVSF